MDTPPLIDVSLRKERQELQPQSLLQQELGNVETCTALHAASGRHCSSDKVAHRDSQWSQTRSACVPCRSTTTTVHYWTTAGG